jgi:hypothetical protein
MGCMPGERPARGAARTIKSKGRVWLRTDVKSTIDHFQPTLSELDPIAVFVQIGKETPAKDNPPTPRRTYQDTLHLIVFLNSSGDDFDVDPSQKEKLFAKESTWKPSDDRQLLDLRVYPLPFPFITRAVNTLEDAIVFFNLREARQIYPAKAPGQAQRKAQS